MFIINKQFRAGERERELRVGKPLLVCHIRVDNFSQTHGGKQLLITSKAGVLRPSSDNSKDEAHMICTFMRKGKTLLFIQTFQNKHNTKNIIHLKPNDHETSGNIDVMHICHSVK